MIRKIAVILSAVLMLRCSMVLAGDAGMCYTIQDTDARSYCLAKAHNSTSYCYSIQNSSERAECLAEVTPKK